jgi:NAD-dependent SIR2 family protein deacetylase
MICQKCNVPLEPGPVTVQYMENAFPVELPRCPKCGLVFVPETLAIGKMLEVEKALEDK